MRTRTARRGGLAVVIPLAGTLLGACGNPGPQATPTPTPVSRSDLQRLYTTAANTYNAAEQLTAKAENMFCDPHSAMANLAQCQAALGQDRQTTIAFDAAIRAITFSGAPAADAAQLLTDDANLETLLEQAATAPSLSAISQLTNQVFPALNTAANDAVRIRSDLGLPAPT